MQKLIGFILWCFYFFYLLELYSSSPHLLSLYLFYAKYISMKKVIHAGLEERERV